MWKLIRSRRGFCRVSLRRLRVSRKVPFMDLREPGKTCSLVFGRALSISIRAVLTLHILGLEPFSGSFSVTIRFSWSMSVHCRRLASPDRIAVSFKSWAKAAFFL